MERTQTISIPSDIFPADITGQADEVLRYLQDEFSATVSLAGNEIRIAGDPVEVEMLVALFADAFEHAREEGSVALAHVKRTLGTLRNAEVPPRSLRDDVILTHKGHALRPKTAGQKRYVDAMRESTLVFAIGPAGTGKTYLAMAMALAALQRKEVGRIVLSRPIVEAGENLGFLPGTLTEKVDPYIRPLYDALYDMADAERANHLIASGIIEIAPLAFMRGRTLNDSFVILDEAQNTTPEQMKMFLTRLGFGSRMVVTGDITQTDLHQPVSGLVQARDVLEGIPDISFCDLSSGDVVRHSLVSEIIAAYAHGAARTRRDG